MHCSVFWTFLSISWKEDTLLRQHSSVSHSVASVRHYAAEMWVCTLGRGHFYVAWCCFAHVPPLCELHREGFISFNVPFSSRTHWGWRLTLLNRWLIWASLWILAGCVPWSQFKLWSVAPKMKMNMIFTGNLTYKSLMVSCFTKN